MDAFANKPDDLAFFWSQIDPILCSKMTDNKIMIRQKASKILRRILMVLPNASALNIISEYLTHESWHVRDEVLLTIIGCLLERKGVFDSIVEELVKTVLRMLDDSKGKVKTTAIEVLAVINELYISEEMSDWMDGYVEEIFLFKLLQRFDNPNLA